jgi:hypothetical protein
MTAGAAGCTFHSLQLRAKTVAIVVSTILNSTLDTTVSQTTYGKKSYTLPIRSEIAQNTVQDLLNGIVAIYQNPRPIIGITVYNTGDILRFLTHHYDVSNRITIIEPQSGFNNDVWVENMSHKIIGPNFTTQLSCEQVWTNAFAVWDGASSLWGTSVFGF